MAARTTFQQWMTALTMAVQACMPQRPAENAEVEKDNCGSETRQSQAPKADEPCLEQPGRHIAPPPSYGNKIVQQPARFTDRTAHSPSSSRDL